MDLNQLTEKAQEALRQAQALARGHGHPQVDVEHVALALFTQEGGIAPRVAEKAGVNPAILVQSLQQALGRMPRVSGTAAPAGQIYISPRVDEVFRGAETEAQRMKDEYISVEHILLAIAGLKDGPVVEALRLPASLATSYWRRSPKCAADSASQALLPRAPTKPLKSMGAISRHSREIAGSTRSLAGTRRFGGSSRFSLAAPRTTPC